MEIKVINTSKNPMPEYKTEGAAGMDIRVSLEEDVVLKPLERRLFPTGLFMSIPKGYEAQIRPRSGLSIKQGISLINCVGTIDSDYRGEIMVPLVNISNEEVVIKDSMRVAQMIIAKYERVEIEEVSELDSTTRGSGGFGSTGIK